MEIFSNTFWQFIFALENIFNWNWSNAHIQSVEIWKSTVLKICVIGIGIVICLYPSWKGIHTASILLVPLRFNAKKLENFGWKFRLAKVNLLIQSLCFYTWTWHIPKFIIRIYFWDDGSGCETISYSIPTGFLNKRLSHRVSYPKTSFARVSTNNRTHYVYNIHQTSLHRSVAFLIITDLKILIKKTQPFSIIHLFRIWNVFDFIIKKILYQNKDKFSLINKN